LGHRGYWDPALAGPRPDADAGHCGVTVAVTSVGARNVKFDIKVDDQPKP
jgi:hypothetical protein